jgi:hypothetical protein
MLLQIRAPLTILVLGLLVFAVVAAGFLPLVELIEGLGKLTPGD